MDICQAIDCKKLSRFGHEKEKPLRCFEHRLEGMRDVKCPRKTCQTAGCEKYPIFGYIPRQPLTCSRHKTHGMADVQNKRCDHEGCSRLPSFAMPGQHAIRCSSHRENGMIDVNRAKKCTTKGCSRAARHKDPVTNAQACDLHVRPGMARLPKKSCNCAFPGCTKQRNYGTDPKKPSHCGQHKLPGMMVSKARCTAEGCQKLPSWGFVAPERCARHKMEGMRQFYGRLCKSPGCLRSASFGVQHRKPIRCLEHKTTDMTNVIAHMQPCVSCGLQTRADIVKKGLCYYCRPATMPTHSKELVVKKLLQTQLGHIDFVHDRVTEAILECACRKYRPDFWAELPTFVLVIEVDEHQHEQYEPSCELRRLVELLAACMGKPLVVIRYNPDGYKIQGETERTSTKKRQAALIDTIRKYENRILDKILTVEYMFYTDLRQAELETELATHLQAYVSAGE